MKKSILLLSGAVLLGFGACKKDDKNDTQARKDLIIGTWNLSQMGIDVNDNSVLDANEATTSVVTGTVSFNANGNVYSALNFGGGISGNDTSSWAFENNEQVLRIIDADNDTDRINVTELTANRLVLLDKADTLGTWQVLTK